MVVKVEMELFGALVAARVALKRLLSAPPPPASFPPSARPRCVQLSFPPF